MQRKGLDFSVLIIIKIDGREQESAWSPTLYRLRGSFSRFYVQRMKVNMMCQLDLMIAIEIFDLFSKTGDEGLSFLESSLAFLVPRQESRSDTGIPPPDSIKSVVKNSFD